MAGFEAIAVEKAGDQIVAGDQRQLGYGRDDVSGLLRCPRRRLGNRISL